MNNLNSGKLEPFGLPLQRSLDFALVFSLLAGRFSEDVNPELLYRYTKTFTLKKLYRSRATDK
jgi:hypothetical protein